MEQVNNAVSLINSIKDIHTETGFKQIHIITSYSILSQYFHNKCLKYLKVINVYITQSWSIFEHSEVLAMIFEVGFVWYLRSWRTPPPTLWSLSPLMWVTGRRVLTALTQSLPAEFFRSPQISMKMRAIQPTGSTSWVRWGVMVNVEGHLVYDKLQKINLKWLLWGSIKFCLLLYIDGYLAVLRNTLTTADKMSLWALFFCHWRKRPQKMERRRSDVFSGKFSACNTSKWKYNHRCKTCECFIDNYYWQVYMEYKYWSAFWQVFTS